MIPQKSIEQDRLAIVGTSGSGSGLRELVNLELVTVNDGLYQLAEGL